MRIVELFSCSGGMAEWLRRAVLTVTIASEPGTSLRAAGWRCLGEAGGGSWSRKSRPRIDRHPKQMKLRWEAA